MRQSNRDSKSSRSRSVSSSRYNHQQESKRPTSPPTSPNNNIPPSIPRPKRHTRSKSDNNTWSNNGSNSALAPVISPRRKAAFKKHVFQNIDNVVNLSVRSVDIANRTAFERINFSEYARYIQSNYVKSKSNAVSQQRKISPSLQHLNLLERIFKQEASRQICWSAAISREADPFFGWIEEEKFNNSISHSQQNSKRSRLATRADQSKLKQHRAIDPNSYFTSTLPTHFPQLTNKKYRLPMRSDVGFPRATEEEVRIKQEEIQRESELEETCPRLVVLAPESTFNDKNTPGLGRIKSTSLQDKDKPSQTSVFAPSLDATLSTTNDWRPRPYCDKPGGLSYLVVSPIDVSFEVGDVEPLLCSMSLYFLPLSGTKNTTHHNNKRSSIFEGKISENYIFQAGNWKNITQNSYQDEYANNQTWREERKKALFSYDHNVLANFSTPIEESLYIVLEVHKVTQSDSIKNYVTSQPQWSTMNSDGSSSHKFSQQNASNVKKDHSSKSRKFFKGVSSRSSSDKSFSADIKQATDVFQHFGTQFLTPIAFGIAPVLPKRYSENSNFVKQPCGITSSSQWPCGESQSMQLFTFPQRPESEDDFTSRLSNIAFKLKQISQRTDPPDSVEDENTSCTFSNDDNSILTEQSFDSANHTKSRKNIFKKIMGKKKKYKDLSDDFADSSVPPFPDLWFSGRAKLFTSFVGVDFTQVMLSTPDLFTIPNSSPTPNNATPRLLVDVSGDCAIMVNSENVQQNRRKSNLSRLPPSKNPGEYSSIHEVKEILFFPPRAPKVYECDLPASSLSFINLLYLYPRNIKLILDSKVNGDNPLSSADKKKLNKQKFYSVRIRLMNQKSAVDSETGGVEYIAQKAIYNPASSINDQPLLECIYTKIPHNISHNNNKNGSLIDVLKNGISMRDEIKLRLPTVLNGTQFLHFSLFSINVPDSTSGNSKYTTELMAENKIPISTASKKVHGSSGAKVTTVIPNGIHRIKLGIFQLNLETRLASSIHVSDPSVATMLRDFPFLKSPTVTDLNSIGHSNSSMNEAPASPDTLSEYLNIISFASEQAVTNHFHALVFMFVSNLVNNYAPRFDFKNVSNLFQHLEQQQKQRKFTNNKADIHTKASKLYHQIQKNTNLSYMMVNIMSMLEVVRKVKEKFKQFESKSFDSSSSMSIETCGDQLYYFFKEFFDFFDEASCRQAFDDKHGSAKLMSDSQSVDSSRSSQLDLSSSSRSSRNHTSSSSDAQLDTLADNIVNAIEDIVLEDLIEGVVDSQSIILMNQQLRKYNLSSPHQKDNSQNFHYRNSTLKSLSRMIGDAPFSRKAYGITMADRMRAEAELEEETIQYRQSTARVFDDEDTIFTSDTRSRFTMDRNSRIDDEDYDDLSIIPDYNNGSLYQSDKSITDTRSIGTGDIRLSERVSRTTVNAFPIGENNVLDLPENKKGFRGMMLGAELSFAKRVNSVAQIMIAPCMAPAYPIPTGLPMNGGNGGNVGVINTRNIDRQRQAEAHISAIVKAYTESLERRGIDPGNIISSNNYVSKKGITSSSIVEEGSDVEDETFSDGYFDNDKYSKQSENNMWTHPYSLSNNGQPRKEYKLRGIHKNMEDMQLEFSFQFSSSSSSQGIDSRSKSSIEKKHLPYLYESIFTLIIQAWLVDISPVITKDASINKSNLDSYMVSKFHECQHVSSKSSSSSFHSAPTSSGIYSFITNLDFLLPVCLKSFALRISPTASNGKSQISIVPSALLDKKHMNVLELVIEICVRGILYQSLAPFVENEETEKREEKKKSWEKNNNILLDFMVGLIAIIHPAQVSILIEKYFSVLRSYDNTHSNVSSVSFRHSSSFTQYSFPASFPTSGPSISWTPQLLHTLQRSRQLRIQAIQRFSSIPKFVSLNYPLKYPNHDNFAYQSTSRTSSSWMKQENSQNKIEKSEDNCPYADGVERLPAANWLAELLMKEGFSICVSASQNEMSETLTNQQLPHQSNTSCLSKENLLSFQLTAVQSMSCIYESLIRRNAMDQRFQSKEARHRVAAMFTSVILQHSIDNIQLLAKMESTYKVRSLWLLSFLYILQEAPETYIQQKLLDVCAADDGNTQKVIRLLKLCTFTFQYFISKDFSSSSSTAPQSVLTPEVSETLASAQSNNDIRYNTLPWLVQESFNTICATSNLLVDEWHSLSNSSLDHITEKNKIAKGLLDLLLHIVTTPQSSVTHLRALGGVSQALDKFGVALSLQLIGDHFQHWARVILSLMNSTSLSVRSIAVDLVVSIFCGYFDEYGNIDEISVIFLTVMPEVIAREIGLYSISEKILRKTKRKEQRVENTSDKTSMMMSRMEDVQCALWPLRRALADIEEASPMDDERVDAQVAPMLGVFCKTCQAVIDGVEIELRLMVPSPSLSRGNVGTMSDQTGWSHFLPCAYLLQPTNKSSSSMRRNNGNTSHNTSDKQIFDADEESLFEAANFFQSETAPLQRLRWLITLKTLHESKGQWVEAAETLLLCARTIADALPHIKNIWRPSRYALWHDAKRSLWLKTIGGADSIEDDTDIEKINTELMKFADKFLEPPNLLCLANPQMPSTGKLFSPTIPVMCRMLTSVTKEAVSCYLEEDAKGLESLAYLRLEQLLTSVIQDVVEDWYRIEGTGTDQGRSTSLVEENAALRNMSASLNGDLTKLAERIVYLAGEEDNSHQNPLKESREQLYQQHYVRVILHGKRPSRFEESTAIPTYLEWSSPSICRVPKEAIERAYFRYSQASSKDKWLEGNSKAKRSRTQITILERLISESFAQPLLASLTRELPSGKVVLSIDNVQPDEIKQDETVLVVTPIHIGSATSTTTHTTVTTDSQENSSMITSQGGSKKFYFSSKKSMNHLSSSIELTVANRCPCALSRQRTIIMSEYKQIEE